MDAVLVLAVIGSAFGAVLAYGADRWELAWVGRLLERGGRDHG